MKAKEYSGPRTEAFAEFNEKLSRLHLLIAAGRGDDDDGDRLRHEMDGPYRRLSKEEVLYFEDIAIEFKRSRAKIPNAGKAILSRDVEIKGSLVFDGELLFDGKLEGEIVSEGALFIGENAVVQGEVKMGSLVIYGKVHGNIVATKRCELKSGCILQGELKTPRLVIEEGASFVGKSEITASAAGAAGNQRLDIARRDEPAAVKHGAGVVA